MKVEEPNFGCVCGDGERVVDIVVIQSSSFVTRCF